MTKLERVSQAGKRGYIDDLSAAFSAYPKDLKIAMTETDPGEEFVDTRQLLQVLAAMMPQALVPRPVYTKAADPAPAVSERGKSDRQAPQSRASALYRRLYQQHPPRRTFSIVVG